MLVRPLCVVTLITLLLWGILTPLFRSSSRAAILSSSIIAIAFGYRYMHVLDRKFFIPDSWEFGIWVTLTIVISSLLAVFWRWHKLLNILSVWLILATVAQIGYEQIRSAGRISTHLIGGGDVPIPVNRPDIIYIILDGYGRSDALKRALGFNNDSFIAGLQGRGFYVAEDAHSNYCQTELSVSSSLNMDFIQDLLPRVTKKDSDRAPLGNLLDHNAAAKYLRDRGYTFASITTGFPPLQFPSADIDMRSQEGLSLIESALVQMTPIGGNRQAVESMFDNRRTQLSAAFDSLESLAIPSPKPRFVIVHILAPHPPFVFGPDGERLKHHGTYGFWDGSDFMDEVGKPEDYQRGYSGQAEYIGKRMLQSLDILLKQPGPKPVIIIQGDHGSKLRLDQATLVHTDVNECFPNLNAFLVPDSVRKNLYPGETPVNSFRILFNGIFGDHLGLKPDRSWYSSFPFPYDFTDVTDRISDHTKMASTPVPVFPSRNGQK